MDKIKALFFAQYLNQKVFIQYVSDRKPQELTTRLLRDYLEVDYLLLRSIDSLTDEEKIIISDMLGHRVNHLEYTNTDIKIWHEDALLHIPSSISDHLRSIGILLPFTYLNENNKPITLSPAQIIEMGWAKL